MGDSSKLPSPRLVAAIDFGTTFSGFAYAHTSDPRQIYTLYAWPEQNKGGGAPYCKTVTSSYYKPAATKNVAAGKDQKHQLVEWGWPARVRFSNDLRDLEVFKRQNLNCSPHASPQVGHYLQRFKLHLASKDEDEAAPALPPGLSSTRAISDFLQKMGEFIMTHLREKYGKHFTMKVIQWCVSVPSIWDDAAKQKMKECMKDAGLVGAANASPYPPLVVLEPEAASLYCHQKCKDLNIRMGDRFLVVDVGGGTTDIVMQEKVSEGETLEVQEVTQSSGGLCGGVDVDKNFISFLSKKIGCLQDFLVQNPATMQALLHWWEGTKHMFDGQECSGAELTLSAKLCDAWEKHSTMESNTKSQCTSYEEVMFSCSDLKQIFDPVVNKIIDLINAQTSQSDNIKMMVLVGGFSGSPYLMNRIKDQFESPNMDIVVPPDPGSAVCQGAVALALNQSAIKSRRAKRSYGIRTSARFREGVDPLELRKWYDGIAFCDNQFGLYVRKGESVQVDENVTRQYVPVEAKQVTMTLELFSSEVEEPKFTTESGCVLEGTVKLDLSEDLNLGTKRQVEVTLFFGRSCIEVKAVGMNFGSKKVHNMLPVSFESERNFF